MRRIAVFVASAALIVSLLPPEALRHSAGVSCKDKTGFRSISQTLCARSGRICFS
jgi:hypothetical protein